MGNNFSLLIPSPVNNTVDDDLFDGFIDLGEIPALVQGKESPKDQKKPSNRYFIIFNLGQTILDKVSKRDLKYVPADFIIDGFKIYLRDGFESCLSFLLRSPRFEVGFWSHYPPEIHDRIVSQLVDSEQLYYNKCNTPINLNELWNSSSENNEWNQSNTLVVDINPNNPNTLILPRFRMRHLVRNGETNDSYVIRLMEQLKELNKSETHDIRELLI